MTVDTKDDVLCQVGGVHFSLLSKVRHDIGDSCSLDYLIDSIFPLFRKRIEPDLHHAQVFGCFVFFSDFCFLNEAWRNHGLGYC